MIGIVGAAVIGHWAYGLLRETGFVLLDTSIESPELAAIQEKIEGVQGNRVSDLHVWRVGPADYAAIISIVTDRPQKIGYYKGLLADFKDITHLTIELHVCEGESCLVH